MTPTSMKAKVVRIKVEPNDGLFIATSPDLKGLLVAERSAEDLDSAISKAITDLYAACGVAVVVSPTEEGAWVAFPADVARAGLAVNRTRESLV